jgi:hypothetical protein
VGSLMDPSLQALVGNVHRDMKTAGPVIRLPASNLISTSHYHQTHHCDSSSFTTLPHRRLHRTPPRHLYLRDSSSRPSPHQHFVDHRHPLLLIGFLLIQREQATFSFCALEPYYRIPSIHRSPFGFHFCQLCITMIY